MMRRAWWLLATLVPAVEAWARVGGGESYSGGGSSSSGGGGGDSDGGGGAEIIFYILRFLLWLTIEYPAIGIPVDILVIIGVIMWLRRRPDMTSIRIATQSAPQPARNARLDELRKFDPNFSEVTFTDFCYSLYAKAHTARGTGDLDRYGPYLSPAVRTALRAQNPRGLREVRGVIVGAMRVVSFAGLDTPQLRVTLEYEGNYTEVTAEGSQSWYTREMWVLERRRDILSPPPEKAKADHCPRCGAALATRTDGACQYCGVKIDSGAFQWYVRSITGYQKEARGPLLTSNVPEQGTGLPTVRHSHFELEPAFEARVREIAAELQEAWTARDWERVRPLESEPLFQMHRYWIDAYREQKLRNIVADYRVTRIEPVKQTADAFYEAITVRIFGEGRDHTVDESGNVVAGSKTELRRWSEYWTFIRSRGAGGGTQARSCPNCGAKVALGATGICDYCGGKLTAGEFDWVLSRIEQDESYS